MLSRTVHTTGKLLTASVAVLVGMGAEAGEDERPNVLFLLTDQQSATMMSATGNPHLETPAMDRIAEKGTRFTRAYVTNPVCLPSRFSIMTGLMPSAYGIRDNGGSDGPIPEKRLRRSLGHLLRSAGYKTAYGGKVHLPAGMNPKTMGFARLTGNRREGLAKAAARFVKKSHDKPFFLVASFINPHDICYMAINAYRRSQGKDARGGRAWRICKDLLEEPRKDLAAFVKANAPPLPPNHAVPDLEPEAITERYLKVRPFRLYVRREWSAEQWRLHRWLYARLTERVDKQIGRVLRALREADKQDDTLVIFSSEHGDHDGAHKLEHKSIPYEEAARVPLAVRWPGKIPAGRVDRSHLVSVGLDILPTLCDYAGVEAPEGLPGRSLRPLLGGGDVDWREHLVVESDHARMLRTDRYKYVVYNSGKHRERLTDLWKDPGETVNLAEQPEYRDVLNDHRRRLRSWVQRVGDEIGAEYLVPPGGS